MPFETVPRFQSQVAAATVRAALRFEGSPSAGRRLVVKVTIGPDVGDLGAGWEKGHTVTVGRGTGKDLGKLSLKRGPGYTLTCPNKASRRLMLTLPAWDGLPTEKKHRAEDGAWRWDAEARTLIVTLPAWAGRPDISGAKGGTPDRGDNKVFHDIDDDIDRADRLRGKAHLPKSPAPALSNGSSLGPDQC